MNVPIRLPPLSVLVVDSDDDTRAMYVQAFAAAGWSVAEAESGPLAIAKALGTVPDVLVTELRLAGIDGYELLRILRRDPDTAQIVMIAISGDAVPASLDRARTSGADLVFSKPCVPDMLIERAAAIGTARAGSPGRRSSLEQLRATATAPERAIPPPLCPVCGTGLTYARAHATQVGRRTEQWFQYKCLQGCGEFEYRQRTRKLRKIS